MITAFAHRTDSEHSLRGQAWNHRNLPVARHSFKQPRHSRHPLAGRPVCRGRAASEQAVVDKSTGDSNNYTPLHNSIPRQESLKVDVARTGAPQGGLVTQWIGPKPSRAGQAAVLAIGTLGMLITGVQPVLLGSLVMDHRLSTAALGWATTAEFTTLALGIWLAATLWNPTHLRARVTLAALLAIIADCLVRGEHGTGILINRSVAGLPEGVLVWVTGCMVARSPTPTRLAAIFFTLQNVSQFAFAAVVPATLMHWYGTDSGFLALAGTAALAIVAAPFAPASFVELPAASTDGAGRIGYTPAVVACLVCVFLVAAFSIGLFAYIEPLGAQAHLDALTIGYAVSAVLGASTLGSALAAVAAGRLSHYAVFAACMLINTVVLLVFAAMPGTLPFLLAAALFGFFWLFFLPFQTPMAIGVDPTRRIAVLLPGAQLLGAAAGPLLISFFVTDTDARGALPVCWCCFLIAFAIATVQRFRYRPSHVQADHA